MDGPITKHSAFEIPEDFSGLRSWRWGLEKNWSVESLAREASMSRSAFALGFRTILRQTPLEYLTQWRMYRACAMIRANNTSLSEVASAVGYGSESSFSVFRREMGLAPRNINVSMLFCIRKEEIDYWRIFLAAWRANIIDHHAFR